MWGGIWEINFRWPVRGEQSVQQWDGGVRGENGTIAQGLIPAGLKGSGQFAAHPL